MNEGAAVTTGALAGESNVNCDDLSAPSDWRSIALEAEATLAAALSTTTDCTIEPGTTVARLGAQGAQAPGDASSRTEVGSWTARSESGAYLAVSGDERLLHLTEHDPGVTLVPERLDAFGLERVTVTMGPAAGTPYRIGSSALEEALARAGLVLAAGASARLGRLITAVRAEVDARGSAAASPLGHQAGQFTAADVWRDAAATRLLVERAGDLLAERSWNDPTARGAVWLAKIAATEALVAAANGLANIFGHEAWQIPGLLDEIPAAHAACASFLPNRLLRLRLAGLQGMDGP